MKIYERDYSKRPSSEELDIYNEVLKREVIYKNPSGEISPFRKNYYYEYPEAIRHYNSFFPNNHIELFDWKKSGKMFELTNEFETLIHDRNTTERDVLKFINHKPAHFIIGALLLHKNFGHHDAYIFPEFSIGYGKFYADYLIAGKNSGGYEFVFVELEAPNGSTAISDGHDGLANRKCINQILDWRRAMESDYNSIADEFKKMTNKCNKLPNEFKEYDSTRMHYVVVSGLREHYNAEVYYGRREKLKNQRIEMYHYDNLVDMAKQLEEKSTF